MKSFLRLFHQFRYVAIALFSAVAVIGIGAWLFHDPPISSTSAPAPASVLDPTIARPSAVAFGTATSSPAPSIQPSPTPPAKKVLSQPVKTSFGHLPYGEDDLSRLESAGRFVRESYEREETLDLEATKAFAEMIAAAKVEGVRLMPISGFRTIADQKVLFEKQIARRGSEAAAARWSAPPGYSEHHTGYAIDIGDQQSDTDLKLTFQATNAYQWLKQNAQKFGFEQSFPPYNRQGVSFEPWHWRYTGSQRAAEIFTTAKRIAAG